MSTSSGPFLRVLASLLLLSRLAAAAPQWRSIAAGVEYSALTPRAETELHVVRIDPVKARLQAHFAAAGDKRNRTAAAWARDRKLVAVVNAGMYQTDFSTHTGWAKVDGRERTRQWTSKYLSAFVLDPLEPGLPPAAILDLDSPNSREHLTPFRTAMQNLRLIKGDGVNVWKPNGRAWSEVALASDAQGRLLFLFCRKPLQMHDFNAMVLGAGLGVVRAQHLEGGPEASLSVHGGGVDLDFNGCRETGFVDSELSPMCAGQWELPNVIGVAAR